MSITTEDRRMAAALRAAGPGSGAVVLTNARIVRADEVVHGSLRVVDGLIDDIGSGGSSAAGAIDLDGDFLLPGLIDVHTDNLEKHAIPRPGVFWDGMSAAVAHDHLIVGAGITTVFDSLCVGAIGKPDRVTALPTMISGLKQAEAHGLLRATHLLHLRCDVTEPTLPRDLEPCIDDPALAFVTMLEDSLRRDAARYRSVSKRRGIDVDKVPEPQGIPERRRWLASACRERGIAWGNHDDTMAWHIDEGAALGMQITEFPVTLEAAKAAAEIGMPIIGGAPNLVLGRSHAGGLSMRELIEQRLLDMLCSDYIPASLLHAVFTLAQGQIGLSLPQATALVSSKPAEVFGLADRGAIEIGLRADMIRVAPPATPAGAPMLRASWHRGIRVL
jgi:alpha-D-ribose 1-methylphosphonate 5-triphosphate diphosphatase